MKVKNNPKRKKKMMWYKMLDDIKQQTDQQVKLVGYLELLYIIPKTEDKILDQIRNCVYIDFMSDEKIYKIFKDCVYEDICDEHGKTVLFYAVQRKNIEETKRILSLANFNVNHKDEDGNSALFYAESVEILELLLNDPRVDINQVDWWGNTVLFKMVRSNNLEIIKLLIKHKININSKNNDGRTVLFTAVRCGFFDIIKLLIENDIDTTIKDKDGELAIDKALSKNLPIINKMITINK